MKTPKKEIERAKTYLKDYKERAANGEHFTTWEEFEKELNITPEQEREIERETQKILAKIHKHNAKLTRKAEKHIKRYVKV